MNPNKITASRIKSLRIERGESQQEFCDGLGKLMGKPAMAPMTVSNWETGRKFPPFDTMLWIQRYYGVSLDYLAGLSDDKTIGASSSGSGSENLTNPECGTEIPYRDLAKHDGDPVFVTFPASSNRSQWGIVDFSNKRIIFATFNAPIDPNCRYDTYIVPEAVTIQCLASHLLNLKDIMNMDHVFIESLSPDPFIRGKISGWYKHNPDHTFLMNDSGYTLSYEGLGINYNAIEFKSTRKVPK